MRLFIAIPLDATVIAELTAISIQLRPDQNGLRWSSPESWHITLQFLGNTSQDQYNCLLARLRVLRSSQIRIVLDGLGDFDRVGVFFAGVNVTPQLQALHQRITAATAQCGFTTETRPFHPHVTLARAKGEKRSQTLRELKVKITRQPKFTSFVATEVLLYEAFLSSEGSRYEIRERFDLSNS